MTEEASWTIGEISADRFKQILWNETPATSIPEFVRALHLRYTQATLSS